MCVLYLTCPSVRVWKDVRRKDEDEDQSRYVSVYVCAARREAVSREKKGGKMRRKRLLRPDGMGLGGQAHKRRVMEKKRGPGLDTLTARPIYFAEARGRWMRRADMVIIWIVYGDL